MRKSEWILFCIVIASILTAVFFYPQLPPVVASHWDAAGQVNGYMTKGWGVAIFPIIIGILFALFFAIPRIDPRRENIEKFRRYFDYLAIVIFFLFYYFFLLFLFWNLGVRFNFTISIVPALSLLFWVVGMIMPYVEQNWFIGVRTPWTISSKTVWKKTHKAAGIWFEAAAIIGLLGIAFPRYAIWFIVMPIIVVAIGLVVYSYVLYEREQ
ncbi:MAG TPA: SdpI family protein [Candidatus Paceibacterota bacterium]|nr:SdpI family protein [Candidatus Paceibacterota bacterium]